MAFESKREEVQGLLLRQLNSLYPVSGEDEAAIETALGEALVRCEACFSKVRNKYYNEGGITLFDPLHGCQWAAFLYYISNTIYHAGGGCCL